MFKNVFLLIVLIGNVFIINNSYATSSILLLGDSLSASYGMKENEGWVSLLNGELAREQAPYKIINASISGETTAGALARLSDIFKKNKIDYLLVELGGNDGLRGFPPTLIKNNLLQIIQLSQSLKVPVFLMEIKIPPNYGPRYSKLFGQIYRDVSAENNVQLLPFFVEQVATKPQLMQADGIHPNKKAQPLLAKIMKEQLTAIITH